MPGTDEKLELHLALDEIAGEMVEDESENDNDGRVHGGPPLLPDELFGSCVGFDGAKHFVEIDDPFKNTETFTVAVWARPAAVKDGVARGLVGHLENNRRKPGLGISPDGGLSYYESADAGSAVVLPNFFAAANAWVHVAWVKTKEEHRFYRGGELFATKQVPPQVSKGAGAKYWVGRADGFWKGQLAHARVYSRALSQEEIREVMLDDQTANASFQRSHPVEFDVYDEDGLNLLVVDDGHPGKTLSVEIGNATSRVIRLSPPAVPTPSADNHHFELRFRPGALSSAALQGLALAAGQDGWAMNRSQAAADRAVSLYFLKHSTRDDAYDIPAGGKVLLKLQNVSADGAGGARGTRVELKYRQLNFSGETTQLRGSRVRHLDIVNERGRRNIPLHVGFLNTSSVINDGHTSNELRLGITNMLAEGDSIPLTLDSPPAPPPAAPSTFIVSFDVQGQGEKKSWALVRKNDIRKELALKIVRNKEGGGEEDDPHWEVISPKLEDVSHEARWVVKNKQKTALKGGETIQLKVSDLVSSMPSGQANLYVRYRNIHGYWDGQFILGVEKSPQVHAYDKAQATLSGGGTVSWGNQAGGQGNRLKWTERFIAISMERSPAIPKGYVNIKMPTKDIPSTNVYNNTPRSATADGILLDKWEALYAVHDVGKNEEAINFRIEHFDTDFKSAGNWLLVAVVNGDDMTLKLGTGVILSKNSSSTKGSPVPTGTVMMWSGNESNIPDGWVLCDGKNKTPDLLNRFVLGANPVDPAAAPWKFGEAEQHIHTIKPPALRGVETTKAGAHNHAPPSDWYDIRLKGDLAGYDRNGIDRGNPSVKSVRTSSDGDHTHKVDVLLPDFSSGPASATPTWQNRPRWFALCFIMKL